MTPIPHLVGMIHLDSLPGSPGFRGSMAQILERATSDAGLLTEAGFGALMIENYGDAPFFAEAVPPETVAAMTRCVIAVGESSEVVVGVNVLRNDALSAIAIAAATGSAMIRVNVLTGVMYTDQGPITGRAAELLRKREALRSNAAIWADVMVKHATPPPGIDISQAARDTFGRGGADAIVVSGAGTGSAPDIERLKTVREAVGPDARIVVGSGPTVDNLASLTEYADTVIVGSATKMDGLAANPVDQTRAKAIVDAARSAGLDV